MKAYLRTVMGEFLRNESGATAIEYGLIAALISVVLIAGATAVGSKVEGIFWCTGRGIGEVGIDENAQVRLQRCIGKF